MKHELELSLSLSCNVNIIHKKKNRKKCRDGLFECRTCSKKFLSFQALGGHRAGHLRACKAVDNARFLTSLKKIVHGCHVCGLGFATGQALGGHMRGHKLTSLDLNVGTQVDNEYRSAPTALLLQLFK